MLMPEHYGLYQKLVQERTSGNWWLVDRDISDIEIARFFAAIGYLRPIIIAYPVSEEYFEQYKDAWAAAGDRRRRFLIEEADVAQHRDNAVGMNNDGGGW